MRFIVLWLFSIVGFAGCVFLQVWLSKKETKWVGLILPIITFGVSLLVAYIVATSDYYAQGIFTIAITLLLFNIPTVVFFAIYAACRGKRKSGH